LIWTIKYSREATKALKKMDRQQARRIQTFIKEKLMTAKDPKDLGEPLKGEILGLFWKFRIGDYRIIANIDQKEIIIQIIKIGHRREIYRVQ